jgi:outer membrane receptor for monomeric catechols
LKKEPKNFCTFALSLPGNAPPRSQSLLLIFQKRRPSFLYGRKMPKTKLIMALLSGAILFPLKQARAQISHSIVDDTQANGRRATAEDVLVIGVRRRARGGGLIKKEDRAKSVSTVSSEFISKQASIQNAYQYVNLAPGVQVAQSDPYGLSEQGSVNVRGLGQDEIGYVLEGMPLNDIGYYTAFPAQFIDSENIDEISLAQGSAELDSPVISAAGGLMNISMLDPALKPGGSVDVAYGSYHANREYVRLDSGLVGNTGIRAFVSFSHTGDDNWRGYGRDKRTHIDFKFVKEWGDGNRIALVGTYHDGITTNYPYPTLASFEAYGRTGNFGENNLNPSFSQGAANIFSNDYYWPLWVGTWRLFYGSAPIQLNLGDHLKLEGTPYWQYNNGNTPYGTSLTTTGNYQGLQGPFTIALPNASGGAANVMANYNEFQYRTGVNPKLSYTLGHQTLTAGYWFDYGDELDTQSYSGLSPQGLPGDLWADNQATLLKLPNGRLYLAGGDHVETTVNMAYVADTLNLLDNTLTLEAGFKEAVVRRIGTNAVPGPQYQATLNSAEPLPRLSARYKIDAEHQLFIDASTNFRTPAEATLFDTYSGGSVTYTTPRHQPAEYSILEEIGYRYNGPLLTATIDAFNYNFTHRQVTTLIGSNFIAETFDAGGQTSRGVDAEAGLRPWHHFSPYISFEYLHATEDNDFPVINANGALVDYLPTAGKTAIRSPTITAGLALNYDDGTIFGNITAKYVGSQYTSFMNDQKIPGYGQADLTIGYRFPSLGLKAKPELRLNIINLTDNNYLSGVASPSANALPTLGKFGTTVPGSQPLDILAGGFAAIITARQAF